MPYLVLNQRELKERSGVKSSQGDFSRTEALNAMEKKGWDYLHSTVHGHPPGQHTYYFRARPREDGHSWD